jgi:hypothetical protein
MYLWRTRKYLCIRHKDLSPQEKLKQAELYDLRIEREYGFMLSVMGIALAYGLISPLIFGAALLYFILKHFVDKYVVSYTYGHKSDVLDDEGRALCGAHFGTKSDYISHRNIVHKICSIVLFNVILMMTYLFLLFLSKSNGDSRFVPHMYTMLVLVIICVCGFVVHSLMHRKWRKNADKLAQMSNLAPSDLKGQIMYEVPYPYIRSVYNEMEQMVGVQEATNSLKTNKTSIS